MFLFLFPYHFYFHILSCFLLFLFVLLGGDGVLELSVLQLSSHLCLHHQDISNRLETPQLFLFKQLCIVRSIRR